MFHHFFYESFAGKLGYFQLDHFDLPILRLCRSDTSSSSQVDHNLMWTLNILVLDMVVSNFEGRRVRKQDCLQLRYRLGMRLRMYCLGSRSLAGRERRKAHLLQVHKLYSFWYLQGIYPSQAQDWRAWWRDKFAVSKSTVNHKGRGDFFFCSWRFVGKYIRKTPGCKKCNRDYSK